MELDAETIEELGCRSSWESWEFAAVVRTEELIRQERTLERVRWWRQASRARERARYRERYRRNIELERAKRRDRYRREVARDPEAAKVKERSKWQLRKLRMRNLVEPAAAQTVVLLLLIVVAVPAFAVPVDVNAELATFPLSDVIVFVGCFVLWAIGFVMGK